MANIKAEKNKKNVLVHTCFRSSFCQSVETSTSAFLPTPLTPHFRTDYLMIGAFATEWAQLLITHQTVVYPTHQG